MTKKSGSEAVESPSRLIDARIGELGDWRGEMLSQLRTLIKQADPEVVEEVKWRKPSNPAGIPVWYHEGIICTGETYKNHLRLTFAEGASLEDPKGLFNANLESNTTRALVINEGEKIDGKAFKAIVRAAVSLNLKSKKRSA